MTQTRALDVYLTDELVGRIHDTSPLTFEYAETWLAKAEVAPLGPIPLKPGSQSGAVVSAVFENLLPEGELRAYLSEQRKATTIFALLLEVAGDTAGGLVILPAGQILQAPSYEKTSWEALASKIAGTSAAAIDVKARNARISLAGAQDKASIAIFDAKPYLPRGTSPSTHILKPDIKRLQKVWASAVNETFCMQLSAMCAMQTAQAFYQPDTRACIVTRFDRRQVGDRVLRRIMQFDLCQLSGTVSDRKYEKEGGPGIIQCAELIKKFSAAPAIDLRRFVEWIFFNVFIGNNDSHAKNLSMYWPEPGSGRLTPFYDLMCTRIYPGLSRDFAFDVGGSVVPGSIGRENCEGLAKQLKMRPQYVIQLGEEVGERVLASIGPLADKIAPTVPKGDDALIERLKEFIAATTRKTMARLAHAK